MIGFMISQAANPPDASRSVSEAGTEEAPCPDPPTSENYKSLTRVTKTTHNDRQRLKTRGTLHQIPGNMIARPQRQTAAWETSTRIQRP